MNAPARKPLTPVSNIILFFSKIHSSSYGFGNYGYRITSCL
jgi:hypothetical protein